jgi:hypothetical protein
MTNMEIVYFTAVSIILYLAANSILERIERSVGRRLEHRTLAFFLVLVILAVTTFALIRRYTGNP